MVFSRLAYPLIVPILILSLALWQRSNVLLLSETYLSLINYLPYALLAVTGFLCLQFNQFRSLLIAVVVSTAYLLIQFYLQSSLLDVPTETAYVLLATLLPLLFVIISWLPERGVLTIHGLMLSVLISIPAVIAIYLYHNASLLTSTLEYFPLRQWQYSILPLLSTAIYLFSISHQLTRLWFFQQSFDAITSIVLLSLFINFALFDQKFISAVIFIAIQLILIWGVLKQSHDMAYRDELTGLAGRRAMNEALKSPGRKYVMAMMDIDHFKKFNDKYGHDVGDDVLKIVASKIALVTGGGKAYRYGGEEFTVLFKGKELEPCIPHLEAVRLDIASYLISFRETKSRPKSPKLGKSQRKKKTKPKGISVTISIGVAKRNEKLINPEMVLKAADKALYKAKKAGRNCLAVDK